MKKSIFFVLSCTVLATCTASALKKTEAPISILKCSKGHLIGAQEFVDVFRTILTHCQSLKDTTTNFYGCVTENLGITDEDGTPNMSKMNEFFVTIFSEMVIEDIPDFKEELNQCGETYVSEFNGLYEATDSAQDFLKCFTDVAQNFSETIESVCKLEHQFNEKYLESE